MTRCPSCNTELPTETARCPSCEATPATPEAPDETPVPDNPADPVPVGLTRGAVVLLVAIPGIVALGIVLTLTRQLLGGWLFGADATVEDYFSALGDGDVKAALRHTDQAGDDAALLTSKALAPDGSRPGNLRIRQVDTASGTDDDTEDRSTVEVDFQVGGETVRATYRLRPSEKKRYGLFQDWSIIDAFGELEVRAPAAGGKVTVNGVPVQFGEDSSGTFPVFPGRYEVSMPGNALLAAVSQTVVAGAAEQNASAQLQPRLADGAQRAVEQSVRSYVDSCARQKDPSPEGCPFSVFVGGSGDSSNPAWRIETYPQVRAELRENGTVRVDTTTPGVARYTATVPSFGGTPVPVDQRDDFEVPGTASVSEDGTVTFTRGSRSGFLS